MFETSPETSGNVFADRTQKLDETFAESWRKQSAERKVFRRLLVIS